MFFLVISLIDESPDSPCSGGVSPKTTALPPTLKRALSEKEGQTSLQSGGSANKTTQEGGLQNLSEYLLRCYVNK